MRFSGSDMALTNRYVISGIFVDDCWLTTNNNLQVTKNVLIANKSHLRMNLWPKIGFKPIRHSKICSNACSLLKLTDEIVRFCRTKRKGFSSN